MEQGTCKKESIFDDDDDDNDVDEDIDGVPMEECVAEEKPAPKKVAAFKTSQWNTVNLYLLGHEKLGNFLFLLHEFYCLLIKTIN